jgi:hypothetical protein
VSSRSTACLKADSFSTMVFQAYISGAHDVFGMYFLLRTRARAPAHYNRIAFNNISCLLHVVSWTVPEQGEHLNTDKSLFPWTFHDGTTSVLDEGCCWPELTHHWPFALHLVRKHSLWQHSAPVTLFRGYGHKYLEKLSVLLSCVIEVVLKCQMQVVATILVLTVTRFLPLPFNFVQFPVRHSPTAHTLQL